MPRADDHLVVAHAARAAGVAVQEQGVAVDGAQLGEQALRGGVVGIVECAQPRLQVVRAERPREDGHLAHRVGAHHPAARSYLAFVALKVVPPAVDVHEHPRERGGQHGGAVLVQVAVEVGREGVGEAVGEGLEPGFCVVIPCDVGQGLRAVVGNADQDGRAGSGRGVPDDREGLHRVG
jgi:hypothetical protein